MTGAMTALHWHDSQPNFRKAYEAGKLSPVEVTRRLLLARLQSHEPQINAMCHVDEAGALASAQSKCQPLAARASLCPASTACRP